MIQKNINDYVNSLNDTYKNASLTEILTFLDTSFKANVILASSLGLEDQLLTHEWLGINSSARIFVLDTGRLNEETYNVMEETMQTYSFKYEILHPNEDEIQNLLSSKGSFSFYDSIENRKECCDIRKTKPLQNILKTVDAWITGLRKQQSITRTNLNLFEFDETHNIIKINPLLNWDFDSVFNEVKMKKIPYNVLHDKGYPSIGCDPCTRAIKSGEDLRAGRWWWESADQKECGIHISEKNIKS